MLICGINASHTASAVLVRDGQVLSALLEERPTRIKNKSGYPNQAIRVLLEHHEMSWRDVDAWVFGGYETYSEHGMKEGDRSARIMSYKKMLNPMGHLKRLLRNTPIRKRLHKKRREMHLKELVTHGVARELGWQVTTPPVIEEAISDLLVRGEVVARVSGREEFGARSLGNRAILADPSRTDVVKIVNKAIKCRDFWMPFAPSVLFEHADRHIDNPKNLAAHYMILAFDSRNTHEVQAACHPEDATIRPQIVTQQSNPAYHRLLEEFHSRTGRGTILNTSLNIHGEPIVSSPEDAIGVMQRSGLNHLALGHYLISKPAIH